MEISDDSSMPLSSLLCQEDDSCFDQLNDKDSNLNPSTISDYDVEYIEMLMQSETNFQSNSDEPSCDYSIKNDQTWLKCARLDAIQWILNTRAFFGFHFRTAYLSLIYFDRFFSRRFIDVGKLWAIRLLSVACLSLAAKMEECRVPALSEYHIDECNFQGSVIQRMELLVLHTLEWKMNAVTPFAYLHYFMGKFCSESSSKELLSKAIELTLAVVKEINLVEYQPSVIAAAAVLAAYDYQLTRTVVDNKMSIISLWGTQEREHLRCCYYLLQEIEMAKIDTSKPHTPLDLSLCSSVHGLDNSSITSVFGPKRRLTYCDCDHDCPSHKTQKS